MTHEYKSDEKTLDTTLKVCKSNIRNDISMSRNEMANKNNFF
jgi:hypothetical protein